MFSGLFAAGILDVLILPVIALLLGAGAFMQLRLLMQTVATFAKNDMGTGAAAILTPASKFLTEAFGELTRHAARTGNRGFECCPPPVSRAASPAGACSTQGPGLPRVPSRAAGGRSPKPSLLVIAVIGLGIVVIIVGARIVTSLDALAAAQRKRSD